MSHDPNPILFLKNAKEVFREAYGETFPKAKQYVLFNSGTAEDAEDIFQESLAAAWINLSNGRFIGSDSDFKKYVMAIVRHKWLNRLDSAQYKKTLFIQPPEEQYGPVNKEELNKQLEETKQLMESLNSLGDPCREVLKSFYYHKNSLQTIAEEMNYSAESVKTIKYRCMQQLRKIYLTKTNPFETK